MFVLAHLKIQIADVIEFLGFSGGFFQLFLQAQGLRMIVQCLLIISLRADDFPQAAQGEGLIRLIQERLRQFPALEQLFLRELFFAQ